MSLSRKELKLIIEDSQYDVYLQAARLNNFPIYICNEYTILQNKLKWPNAVCRLDLPAGQEEELIQEVREKIRENNGPGLLMCGPACGSRKLHKALEKHGFELAFTAAGMASDLDRLRSRFEPPGGLKVDIVKDEKTLEQWAQIVAMGLFAETPEDAAQYPAMMKKLWEQKVITPFIGYFKGEPVASSSLYIYKETAGLYHVAVLEKFRGQGIGTQISLAPMLHAREMGCETGVLQASKAGERVYKSIGFRKYCSLYRYKIKTE